MRARFLLVMLAGTALLAGCDQNKNAVTVKDKNGSVTVSANGQHVTVQGGDNGGNVTVSGNGSQVTMQADNGKSMVQINTGGVDTHGKLPGFVAVYPGAKVISSVSGSGGSGAGGTIQLEISATPDRVVEFYKQKTTAAGFQQTLDANDAGSLLYAATSGKRTVQVLPSADGTGTHAQVTWSGQ